MRFGLSRVMLILAVGFVSADVASQTRLGTDTEAPPQRLALLVGNSQYQHLNVLKNPKNDVGRLAAKLQALGFQTSVAYDLNHDDFVDAISSFGNKIAPGDIALFYYSGHGVQLGGTNYLIPINLQSGANPVVIQGSGIPLPLVRNALSAARLGLLILDACRTLVNFPAKGTQEGLAAYFTRGALVAYAADEGQAASDNDNENTSLFTKHLILELDKHDENLCQLFAGVRAAVDAASNHVQFPFVYDGVIGDFIFNRTTTVEVQKLAAVSNMLGPGKLWQSIETSNNPNDYAAFLAPGLTDKTHVKLAEYRLSALMSSTAKAVGTLAVDSQGAPDVAATSNQAQRLFYEKSYGAALESYKKLLTLRPSDAVAMYDYGTSLLYLARPDEAIQAFSRAIELDAEFPWAYYNRGVANHLKGKLTDAIVDYSEALQRRPGYALGYNNLALAKRELGELTEAKFAAQKAIDLNPHYAPAFFNNARIYEGLGNVQAGASYETKGKQLTIPVLSHDKQQN